MVSTIVLFHYNPTIRYFAASALSMAGYTVFHTSDAHLAWRMVKVLHPSVIVLDYPVFLNPPLPDGQVTLAEAVRADAEVGDTPILNLTFDAHPPLVEAARRAGVTVSLGLPVTKGRLLRSVARLVRREA